MQGLIRILIALSALALAPQAFAQNYPSKPVRLIVPFPPGGAADLVARLFGQKLGESLGQPVPIENRAGADTIVGMEAAARAPADGYTLILAINSALSMNPALYAKLPYDGSRDFAPISIVASVPLALVVPATSTANSAPELAALLRDKPGALSYGAGNTVARLAAEQLLGQTGTRALPVMYKGSAPTIVDLMRGDVQFAFEPVAVVMPYVKSGKMRALGVATGRRAAAAPDVPTIAESGIAGIEIPVWFGFMAPAGTPREIVARLQADIARAARAPDLQDKLVGAGFEIGAGTPEQFSATVTAERDSWVRRIRAWGIKLD